MSEKPATDGATAQDLIFSQDGIVLDGPKLLRVADASMTAITSQNFTEGQPDPRIAVLFQRGSHDNKFFAGLWGCQPGVLRWAPDADTTAYILEGEAEIELDSGEVIRIEPGDVIATPKGTWSTWRFQSPFKEFVVCGG